MGTSFEKLLLIAEYNLALENEDANKLDQVINKLIKRCNNTNIEDTKELGKQYLNIFNSQSTTGKTAVMIAAAQGRTDILKKWYYNTYYFIRDILFEEDELEEIYKQSNYSYIVRDKEGRSALVLACKSQSPDCIKYILSPETKEILNQRDMNGNLPIEYVAEDPIRNEFTRVLSYAISKKSQYFPNELFYLDKDYAKFIHLIEDENMKNIILDACKKANPSEVQEVKPKEDVSTTENYVVLGHNDFGEDSSNKGSKKRSIDLSDRLEETTNQKLNINGATTANPSKSLKTRNSTHAITKEECSIKAFVKPEASTIKLEQTKKVLPQNVDVDASKVPANNPQKNAYNPESSEYNNNILNCFDTFIGKINNSNTDRNAQKALLHEFKMLLYTSDYSFPEEGIQRISLIDDEDMSIKMIDIILGSSDEFN